MSENIFFPNKADMARNFNFAAATYDQTAVLQKAVAESLLERLDYMKIAPTTILDLGSGTGRAAMKLAQRYSKAKILHMDIATQMLFRARQNFPRWFSRHRYICADIEQLPLASNKIDLVFSNLTLQWTHNLDSVFSQLNRACFSGSLFLFSTLGPDTLKELRESWAACDDEIIHVNNFIDMHDVGDALVRAGFSDPVMEVENMTLTYDDVFGLMRDLKQLGAHNVNVGRRKALTGKKRLSQMIDHYEIYRTKNKLPATYEIIYGHAWVSETPMQHKQPDGTATIPIEAIKRRSVQ